MLLMTWYTPVSETKPLKTDKNIYQKKQLPDSQTHSALTQLPRPLHIGWPGHAIMNTSFSIHVISTLNMVVISTEKLNDCMACSTV